MKISKVAFAVVVASFVVAGLGGCKKEETPGEKLDHAADKAKSAAEDMKKDLNK